MKKWFDFPFLLQITLLLFILDQAQSVLFFSSPALEYTLFQKLVFSFLVICDLYIEFALALSALSVDLPITLDPKILWLNYKGNISLKQGRYEDALRAFQKIFSIFQSKKFTIRVILNKLGLIYEKLGYYPKAIECYKEALETKYPSSIRTLFSFDRFTIELVKDGKDVTLLRLGEIYLLMGQMSQALYYSQQAIDIAEKGQNPFLMIKALNNVISAHLSLGQYSEALRFSNLASQIYASIYFPTYGRADHAITLLNAGLIHKELSDYSVAMKYLQRALRIAQQCGDMSLESSILLSIGMILADLVNFDSSLKEYWRARIRARRIKYRSLEAKILHYEGMSLFLSKELLAATKCLYEAIEILEFLRASELSDFDKISVLETQVSTYQLLQQILISKDKPNNALSIEGG
jgi:tetratricopeptide (TPR) repeat protein